MTAFLEAITARVPETDHRDLQGLQPAGPRRPLEHNAHFLSWLGRVLPDQIVMRTCITVHGAGRSFVFFERVRVLPAARCTDAAGATEMPDELRNALKALTFEVRIAYYGLCKDDYEARVQPLSRPCATRSRAILRGDAEP